MSKRSKHERHESIDESWGTTRMKKYSFAYTWTMHDFTHAVKNDLCSPPFSSTAAPQDHWHIFVFNHEIRRSKYIAVYLLPLSLCPKPKDLTASACLTFLNGKNETILTIRWKEIKILAADEAVTSWSWRHFISYETMHYTLLFDDTLKLRCMINVVGEIITTECRQPALAIPDPKLTLDLGDLLNNELLSDVTLIADGEEFKAHKCILAARSPVFKAMFSHEMKENAENVVEITDVHKDVLREILRFIYTEDAPNLRKVARETLVAAEKYALERLKIMCELNLESNITIENAAELLLFAEMNRSDHLKAVALDFIRGNCKNVLKTDGWTTLILQNLSPVLSDLISSLCEM